MTSTLLSGDTLISSKRFLESALILSRESPKSLLLPLWNENPSLRISLAFLIESIVLHERLFCTFSRETFEKLVLQSKLSKILTLLRPIPLPSLISEMEKHGSPDASQVKHGYEALSSSPSMVIEKEALQVFNLAFPDLATEEAPKNEMPKAKSRGISLREVTSRHFLYYETVASLAVGIAYSLTKQSDSLRDLNGSLNKANQSGYKIYGEQALTETAIAAEEKAHRLNSLLKRELFSVEAPIVFSYVIEKAREKEDLLSVAMDIRNSKEATAFRKQCSLFDQALKDGDDKALLSMTEELEDKIAQLRKRIEGPKLKFDISFPLGLTISPTEIWDFVKFRRKRHLIFISHLYEAALLSRNAYAHVQKLL